MQPSRDVRLICRACRLVEHASERRVLRIDGQHRSAGGIQLFRRHDVHDDDFVAARHAQSGRTQHIIEVAEQVGDHDEPSSTCRRHEGSNRSGSGRRRLVECAHHLVQDAAACTRSQHRRRRSCHGEANGIALPVSDGCEPHCDLARQAPLVAARLGKRHRGRRIHDHGRRQRGAIGRQSYERPVAPSQQPPVDTTWVVTLSIGTKLAELR